MGQTIAGRQKGNSMSEMTESQLCDFIDELAAEDIYSGGDIVSTNIKLIDDYNQELYGDEEDGLSKYVARDVADLVESDEASLVRVFLGAGQPVEFTPVNGGMDAIQEAKDINLLVSHVISTVKNSYKIQADWIKEILLSKSGGYVQYGIEECKKRERKVLQGLSEDDLRAQIAALEGEKGVVSVEVSEEYFNGEFVSGDVEIEVVRESQKIFIMNVPWEDLRISKNAQTKDDCDLFGKKFRKRKSELIADGFDKKIVKSLPVASSDKAGNNEGGDTDRVSGVKSQRFEDQGGEKTGVSSHWQNEVVEGTEDYVLVDFDGDGILERRQVIKVQNVILSNEPFDHIPFAGCSAIQMPHNIVGLSRAELASRQQRVNTILSRNMFDNISDVNMGRVFADSQMTNMDDLTNVRKKGIVRTKGAPGVAVLPEVVPYNGDKTLQIVQYMAGRHAQTTGVMDTNQGLSSDQLHKETATRFEGVKDQGLAKIELVARNIAEMAYKDLYEGIAFLLRNFQDSDLEVNILGREMVFNPSSWKYDHSVKAKVGTGAGDDEKTLQTLSGILQIQEAEIQTGSQLADSKKKYNTLKEIVRASGLHGVSNYFNDPDQPIEMLFAQNEQLKAAVQQMEALLSQRNELAEAEQVKQQTEVLKARLKADQTLRSDELKAMQMEINKQLELLKLEQDDRHHQGDQIVDLTKLELESGQNVPGSIA